MKRVIAGIVAVILICLCPGYAGSAFAEGTPTMTVSQTSAKPGEEAQITVSLSNNPGIYGMTLHFDYDGDRLELLSGVVSGLGGTAFVKTSMTWMSPAEDITYNGVFLTLKFKVKDSAPLGFAKVTVTYGEDEVLNYNDENVYFTIIDGGVSVTHTHTLEGHTANAATCTEDGNIAYWVCSDCGNYFSDAAGTTEIAADSVTIPARGHKLIPYAEIKATCTTTGNIAYWKCSNCNKYFSDADGNTEVESVVTPVVSHKYASFWTHSETEHWHECEYGCGAVSGKAAHDLKDIIDKPATCTEKGSKHQECVCGYALPAVDIPAKGHTLTPHEAKAATCTETGNTAYWSCDVCGKLYRDAEAENEITLSDTVVPAKGHTLDVLPEKAATCTSAGNIACWKCSACGKYFSDALGKNEVSEASVIIPVKPHTLAPHDAKEANCTEAGNTAYWSCNVCSKLFTDAAGKNEITLADTVIDALGHDLTAHEAKAATCMAKGNVAYWSCGRCGKLFSDADGKNEVTDVSTPMVSHKFSTGWSYDNNKHWHACEYGCGTTSEKIAHSLTEVIDKQPTCTEKGSKHQECACGYKTAAEEISALGHKLTAHDAKAATCTAEGNIAYWSCDRCGKLYSNSAGTVEITLNDTVISALGHELTAHDAKAATCTAEGNIAYWSCDRCGKLFSDADGKTEVTDVTTPMIDHKFSTEWTYNETSHWHECEYGCGTKDAEASHSLTTVTDKAATCTEKGSKHQECTCGYKTAAEEISALGHELTAHTGKPATCTEEGVIDYWSCDICGKQFSDDAGTKEVTDTSIPMKPHTLTPHEAKEATCTEAGNIAYWSCDICSKLFSDAAGKNEIAMADTVISALGHKLTAHDAKAATCTAEGNIAYWSCDRCGKLFSDADGKTEVTNVTTPMIDHSYSDSWTYNDSYHWHVCEYGCGTTSEKIAHSLTEVIDQQPTCTEKGSKHQECACGYKTAAEEISALGHKLTAHEAKAATCTEAGNNAYLQCQTCSKCYADEAGSIELFEKDIVIQALGHKLTAHDAKAATCTAEGNIAYWSCDRCGKLFSDADGKTEVTNVTIPMIDHSYSDSWTYNDSYHWHVCEYGCGTTSEKIAHSLTEVIDQQPTCTEKGSKHQECACGYKTAAEEILALGHKLTAHDAKAATCTAEGNIAYWSCDRCGKLYSNSAGTVEITLNDTVISALGHKLTAHDAKAATCTAEGNIAYWSCDRCGKLFSDADGKTEVTNVTIPMIEHKFSTEWTYNNTYHWHVCEYGCVTTSEKIAHSLTEVIDKQPTCTEKGSKHQECTCGYKTAAEEILALGHDMEAVPAQEPTCQASGNIAHNKCKRCNLLFDDAGKQLTEAEVTLSPDPSKHQLEEVAAQPSTCTKQGNIKHFVCKICGARFEDETMAKPLSDEDVKRPLAKHDFSTQWCANDTYHWHVCNVCGEKTDIAAHTFGPWTTSASRKNDNTGKRVRYCTVCKYEQVEKLDNLLSPITGDSSNIVLYTVILASSTIALGAIAITYKKQKREK